MDRFILVDADEAAEKGYPGAEVDPYGGSISSTCLYETDGKKPVRLVASDGGEPEDQTFGRDWSWVVKELNRLAAEISR